MTNTRGFRLRRAERRQVEMVSAATDDLLPADHWVRLVWKHVEAMDLSAFLEGIRAVDGRCGRDATDPHILLCLWLVALSEGVGSARRLEELCTRDLVYRWILGGVTVNRDLLASFRSNRKKELDGLLTQNIAAMMKAGVITLNVVAQDGMKERADAGAASFRREATLKECLEAARKQVERLDAELDKESDSLTRREAARERAAQQKLAAVEQALKEMPAVVAAKKAQKNKKQASKSEARVSTTDPEARRMKMADGGFRPAYNLQFATDADSRFIVGLDVSNHGTDAREVEPVIADVLNRTGEMPRTYLVDGGFVSHANIEGLTELGCTVYAPVPELKKEGADKYAPRPTDPPAVAVWRKRMTSEVAKVIYRLRASTAERTNAELRSSGLRHLGVRGVEKVTSAVLLAALAFNICRMLPLMS